MITKEEYFRWKEDKVTQSFMRLLKDDKEYWLELAMKAEPDATHTIARHLGHAEEAQELLDIELDKLNSNS